MYSESHPSLPRLFGTVIFVSFPLLMFLSTLQFFVFSYFVSQRDLEHNRNDWGGSLRRLLRGYSRNFMYAQRET